MANFSSQLMLERSSSSIISQKSGKLSELKELFFILKNQTNPKMKEQAASDLIEAIRSSQFRGGPTIDRILSQYDNGIPGVSRAYLVQLAITSYVQSLYSSEPI